MTTMSFLRSKDFNKYKILSEDDSSDFEKEIEKLDEASSEFHSIIESNRDYDLSAIPDELFSQMEKDLRENLEDLLIHNQSKKNIKQINQLRVLVKLLTLKCNIYADYINPDAGNGLYSAADRKEYQNLFTSLFEFDPKKNWQLKEPYIRSFSEIEREYRTKALISTLITILAALTLLVSLASTIGLALAGAPVMIPLIIAGVALAISLIGRTVCTNIANKEKANHQSNDITKKTFETCRLFFQKDDCKVTTLTRVAIQLKK